MKYKVKQKRSFHFLWKFETTSSASGPSVDLSSGLTTEVLQPLLENPEFVRKMKELLPEEEQAQDDATGQVRGTLHSPQFRQALGMFSSGLQTGQLAPLIREFNLGDAAIAAATKGNFNSLTNVKTGSMGAITPIDFGTTSQIVPVNLRIGLKGVRINFKMEIPYSINYWGKIKINPMHLEFYQLTARQNEFN